MSVWDLHIMERDDGPVVAECRPMVNGAPALWRVGLWGSVLGQKVTDAWNAAKIREPICVAEMRAWCWRLGAGDIHGVLVSLEALDMLLKWWDVEELDMVVVVGDCGGLCFSDAKRVAHMPGSRWDIPDIRPCRACGSAPSPLRRPECTKLDGSLLVEGDCYHCQCGLSSPWSRGTQDASGAWNEFCGIRMQYPPTWSWSARQALAEHRPTFAAPVRLAWFDADGHGPSIVSLVLEGMSFADRYPPTVRLCLPDTLLDGGGGMDVETLRGLHELVSGAVAWADAWTKEDE